MRTHPEMMCSGTGGFILSGIKVLPEKQQQATLVVKLALDTSKPPEMQSEGGDLSEQRGAKRDRE